MVDLSVVATDAIVVAAQVLPPLFLIVAGFIGALVTVLKLILFIADLF